MKAKTISLEYRPGERSTVQGVKGHWGGKFEGEAYFRNAGYGVGEAFIPSLLLLHTQCEGRELTVRVDCFFKERLGRLIESRRELIKMAMPEEVSIQRLGEKERVTDPMDGITVAEFTHEVVTDDLEAWLSRLSNFTKKEIDGVKKFLSSRRKEKQELQEQEDLKREQENEKIWRRIERNTKQRQSRFRKKMDALIAKGDSKYFKAIFIECRHRHTGELQYEFRKDGKLYILHRKDSYTEPVNWQYVYVERELVPGRIYLVRKETCY